MVTTYSGIVPVTGTLTEISATGVFPLVSFDMFTDSVDQFDLEPNFRTEITVIQASDFFTGGLCPVISFDINTVQHGLDQPANLHTEVTFLNTRLDFSYTPFTTATGIVVVNFGFSSNFAFVVPQVLNRRIFPTDVPNATLFPGDVPRGSSLN